MGLDAPDVRQSIHLGPSDSVQAYVQETGRCGRDGQDSIALLYYRNKDVSKASSASESIKAYCTNKQLCRRQQLMKEFDASDIVERPEPIHKCCDVCEQNCTCKDCRVVYPLTEYEVSQTVAVDVDDYTASPTKKRRRKKHPELHTMLIEYRNSLCNCMDENGRQLPLLIGVEIASGLPNPVINHIVEEADNISSVSDVIECGVMFRSHAQHIFEIIKSFVQ